MWWGGMRWFGRKRKPYATCEFCGYRVEGVSELDGGKCATCLDYDEQNRVAFKSDHDERFSKALDILTKRPRMDQIIDDKIVWPEQKPKK